MLRLLILLLFCACSAPALAADGGSLPWWLWPIALLAFSFVLGMVAVVAGIGGGVLFVPIVSSFFPFHLDFVRGAGLLVALAGALSASPGLLRSGIGDLRLAMPLALVGSLTSILGALLSFAIPARALEVALAVIILLLVLVMAVSKAAVQPQAHGADPLGKALGMQGVRRTPFGLAAFALIGLVGGMFGLGAGWANVPVLNVLMGVPLKLAVGTSSVAISIINTSAAWIYLNHGAVLPIVVVPSVIGIMLGARIGVRVLRVAPATVVRRLIIGVLLFAGIRTLMRGLGLT